VGVQVVKLSDEDPEELLEELLLPVEQVVLQVVFPVLPPPLPPPELLPLFVGVTGLQVPVELTLWETVVHVAGPDAVLQLNVGVLDVGVVAVFD
jgi:hypothetical protein